jgi:glycosyltransferase involved in cell wall biosynthesis
MAARNFGLNLAFWSHVRNRQSDINSIRNRFKYLYIKRCDWWFAYTEGEKQFLVERNFSADKITIVQNAIDTVKLHNYYVNINQIETDKLKESLRISGSHTAIYCGAMYPEKRLDFILEVCYLVKKEIQDFNMIFIGSGIEAYKIEEASKKYNWIHYLGSKFGEERVIYFKISMLQIMPGAIGLGILDSFAMETPIVTTDNPNHGPEVEYLQNGINGIIVKDNLSDYSRAITDIFKNEKYNDLIKGCRDSAEKYTIVNMVDNFRNGIKSFLNSSKTN